jgi:hypothetical protein
MELELFILNKVIYMEENGKIMACKEMGFICLKIVIFIVELLKKD